MDITTLDRIDERLAERETTGSVNRTYPKDDDQIVVSYEDLNTERSDETEYILDITHRGRWYEDSISADHLMGSINVRYKRREVS